MKQLLLMVLAMPLLSGAKPVSPELPAFIVDLDTVAQVMCSSGSLGSGFYMTEGYLITANHVVEGSESCYINDQLVSVVLRDPVKDIAILETINKGPQNNYVCSGYKKKETYYAVGWAYGTKFILKAVTGTGVNVKTIDLPPLLGTAVLRGEFYEGMSGGPVFNSSGYVVGVINGVSRIDRNLSMSRELKDTPLCSDLPTPKP